MRYRSKQRGFTLVEMAIVVGILASVIVVGLEFAERQALMRKAAAEGEALGQFAVGMRGFMAAMQADPSKNPGAQRGVAFLRPPNCGGLPTNPDAGYVPCNFSGHEFGGSYQTTFSSDPATRSLEARTTFALPTFGKRASNRLLMADKLVAVALAQQAMPNNGTFFSAFANVAENATGPATPAEVLNPGGNAGRVVMVINNAPSNDIWLRTDGTNMMLANLNMDGWNLANAGDGRFLGTVQIDKGLVVGPDADVEFQNAIKATDVELTDIGEFASKGVYNAQSMDGPGPHTIAKPDCSKAGGSPGIYVAIQSTGGMDPSGARVDALYSAGARVEDADANWSVYPESTGVKFSLERNGLDLSFAKSVVNTSPDDMRMIAFTRCR